MSRLPSFLSFTLASLAGLQAAEPVLASGIVEVHAKNSALTTTTAEQAEVELSRIPGGTNVIRAETLRSSRTSTMRDALQTSPGVYVQPRQGSEESRLSIRGSGIQRTFHLRGIALLIDGQPINQADGGADFQALDPGLVDHIAVYRGANALRFGSSTLGGAIDFVAPTGRMTQGSDLRIEGGSFGYQKAQAVGGFEHGSVDGLLAVSQYSQEGYRDQSAQANQRAFANIGWRVREDLENRVMLTYARSDSELAGALTKEQMEADPTQANAGSALRDSKRDYPLWRIADRAVWQLGDHRLEAGVGWIGKELFHPLSFGLIEQTSSDFTGMGRWTFGDEPDSPLRLQVGLNAAWGVTDALTYAYANPSGNVRGATTSDAVQTARNLDGYGEAAYRVAEDWTAIVGLQISGQHRQFEDDFLANGDQSNSQLYTGMNPKLGALWQATPAIQGFANISRSFEPPTFSEYVQRDTSGFTRPQQDLEAQSAWTVEVGSRGQEGIVSWDATVYYAMVSDEYLTYQIAPGLTQTTNADSTTHMGLELGSSIIGWEGMDDNRAVIDLTAMWGSFSFTSDDDYGSNQLPGLPEYTARCEVRYEQGPWFTGVVFDWQSDWYVDFDNTTQAEGSVLLGLRGGYQTSRGLSGFFEIRNLTDETYAATTGVANPLSAPDSQSLYNPGDGLGFVLGLGWKD